jgi:peptidoglycan hydrolase-like protein with peptidoglycan-binding domain
LQLSLVSLGLLGGTVDGKFGYNTYKALHKFKTQFGLDGAGFADTATFEALDEAEAMESFSVEEVEDLPIIGDEPEPIRDGVSLGEEEMLG